MPRRWLAIASGAELLTLAVLVLNLATIHLAGVAAALGPIHGFCYLATIALAWQVSASTPVRARSLVPAIGGLLVLRVTPRVAAGSRSWLS